MITRQRWLVFGIGFSALVALAALWRYSPLAAWAQLATVTEWAHQAGTRPWVPVLILAAYTPASITLFPRPLITLFSVLAFGPWLGFAFAFTGIMIAALATYAAGACWDVRKTLAPSAPLARLQALLQRRGVLAMSAIRFVPIAPFAVVNAVAGALRVRIWHFAAGSAIGILPGTATATVLGDRIAALLHAPDSFNVYIIAAAMLMLFGATLGVRRWLFGRWNAR
jgi:phospholipase D1/2